ncbi:hypothetical protein LF1_35940 [Rubripirellula obstinata]|uniref:Uncharacterized protein n=1 Tax=Rubripirellula obstinata TaxID=406547 RepID=A0A5B1CN96_9BACT|nr:hypothetical protein [Rubripirellula obstinata]KAA1261050.1 hypothetical protein LF1_35940 [Rubripirellula obstinata]
MNSTLLTGVRTLPSQHEIDASVESVTRYLIRCGIRDANYLREQSLRIVESTLAAVSNSSHSGESVSGMDSVAVANRSACFQQQCLHEATATMRSLLDLSANQQRTAQQRTAQQRRAQPAIAEKTSNQSDRIESKQFAFLGTDELLFTSQTFSREGSGKPSSSESITQRVAMVIPFAEVRHFKRNATPQLIGPLRLGWWKSVLTSWIPRPNQDRPNRDRPNRDRPNRAGVGNIQGNRRPSKMQASQSDA